MGEKDGVTELKKSQASGAAAPAKRILLRIAYDGTRFAGFQMQKSGVPTIEGELTRALAELTGEDTALIGGSRTDAGVHALDNVAVFDTNSRIPAEKFSYALNARLPQEIRIQSAQAVAPDFHPRHQTVEKTYEYRIYNAPFPSPLRRLYSYFSYTPFDAERMRRAAAPLVGRHDFQSFCSVYSQAATTVREITGIEIEEIPLGAARPVDGADASRDGTGAGVLRGAEGADILRRGADADGPHGAAGAGTPPVLPRELVIRVSGYGFLYNMVRIIAGTLMEAGRGALDPSRVPDILAKCDRRAAGPTAPPEGLTLVRYRFLDGKSI